MRTHKGSEFGKRLADAIDRAQMRQSEVADRCGIHRSDMSRVLKGDRGLNSRQVSKIADLLGVTVESLTVSAAENRSSGTADAPLNNVRPEAQNLPARVQAARDAYLGRHQHELSLAEARWLERSTAWITEDDGGEYDDDFWNQMLAAFRSAHPRNHH